MQAVVYMKCLSGVEQFKCGKPSGRAEKGGTLKQEKLNCARKMNIPSKIKANMSNIEESRS